MKNYETVFVLHPRLDDNQIEEEVQKVKDIITKGGGQIIDVQKWGRKRLAYEIRKVHEGIYTLIHFSGEPAIVQEADRRYKLNENVLRHLTVVAHPSSLRKGKEEAGKVREGGGRPVAKTPPPEGEAGVEAAGAPPKTPSVEAEAEAPPAPVEEAPPEGPDHREGPSGTNSPS